jgi:hypothetical protein
MDSKQQENPLQLATHGIKSLVGGKLKLNKLIPKSKNYSKVIA